MVGTHIQTACFRLLLHPTNGFIDGLSSVNKLDVHEECYDARIACYRCQQTISDALGLPLGVSRMLKAYILRLEKGIQYQHTFE